MAENLQVCKCDVCGNIVEVLHGAKGELVYCGKPMRHFEENTVDAAKEKHVPLIEILPNGVRVKVGDVPHPTEEKHYIEWIEVLADGRTYRQFLNPGEASEAVFDIKAGKVAAQEYCNLPGLWKA